MLLLAAIASDLTSSAPLNHTTNKTETTAEELFEGDIVTSEEMISQHYNITDFEQKTGKTFHFHTREKRAATSTSRLLWPNGVVYYTFDDHFSLAFTKTVLEAMDNYETKTCLRFVQRRLQRNYISIRGVRRGCFSHLGMRGGRRILNLGSRSCNSVGVAEHEIGHAIGFWHEQSRPDRDSYVDIVWDNIRLRGQHNFMKRKANEVNSLGVGYDYCSVMHYPTHAFSKGDYSTIIVKNKTEQESQGCQKLGPHNGLSVRDIQQVNLLYNCSLPSRLGLKTGRLTCRIKVRNGVNLSDTDPRFNSPNPYVKLTAVHNTSMVTRQTSVKFGTQNPTWNELLDFGTHQWKYFQVRIWDKESFGDYPMSMSESIALTSVGSRKNVKHCTNTSCSGYLWLDYYLCPNGWGGDNCAHRWGNLRFFVRYGRGIFGPLKRRVEIIAYNSEGTSVRRITLSKDGAQSPDWNENLYFGQDAWKIFQIRVCIKFPCAHYPYLHQQTLRVRPGSHVRISNSFSLFDGQYMFYIVYDYHFQ